MVKKKIKHLLNSEKFKKMRFILVSGLAIIFVLSAFIMITTTIVKKFTSSAEEVKYIEQNGMKYISIKNGFIAEEMKVEAGDLLPELDEYFNTEYKLDEEASISYLDGDETLEVTDFTYVKDENTYVRGVKNLTAVIKNNDEEYQTKLVIEDTVKPMVQLQSVEITEGEAIDASRFVAIFVDNSQVLDFYATIVGTDEYSKVGNYKLKVNVCDIANNCVVGDTSLSIKQEEVIEEEDISSSETGSGEEDGSSETPPDEGGEDKPGDGGQTPVVADPSLTKLTISKGKLSPAFKSSTKSYKATVENSVKSIKVTATAAKGSTFISNYGTRTVSLKVGANTIYVKVKNTDNKTVAYKIVVTRKAASTGGGTGGNTGGGSGNTGGGTGGNTGGGSGGESGGGNTGGGNGGTTETPEKERVFVEKITSNNFPYKILDHYGSIEYYFANEVTYNLYSDNYVEVLSFDGATWTEWDFTNYKTDVKAMKKEAEDVLAANASTRQYFLEKTNETRAAAGIAPVTLDYDLCIVATMRTFELTYGNTLSHTRPDGKRFYTILKEYGFKAGYYEGTKHYGENMAYWQLSDASAYNALIQSSGHKQNILDTRWKKMGVGTFTFYGRKYWIQLFTT